MNNDEHYEEIVKLLKKSVDTSEIQLAHTTESIFTSEDELVLYSDVNIESIAEILVDVTMEDLSRELGYYGSWGVRLLGDVYMLTTTNTNVSFEDIKERD